jgi:hypothetical protein
MSTRVVQWATGFVGATCLKAVIEHPELELAGVFVYSDEKEGKDAGELVGLGKTGVRATRNKDEILALDADVVLHCPLGTAQETHDADVMALLRSGKNIISSYGYHSPLAFGEDYAAALEAAALEGGVTLFGGGVDPESALPRIAASLTSMCLDVQHMHTYELTDMSLDESPGAMLDSLAIGKPVEDLQMDQETGRYIVFLGTPIIDGLARNLGLTLDKIDAACDFEVFTATKDFEIPVTQVRKGTVCGARVGFKGYWNGSDFLHHEWIWSVERDHPRFPPLPDGIDTRVVIEIEGTPSVRAGIDFAPSFRPNLKRRPEDAQSIMVATAGSVIRSIEGVVAAPPGLMTVPIFGTWHP